MSNTFPLHGFQQQGTLKIRHGSSRNGSAHEKLLNNLSRSPVIAASKELIVRDNPMSKYTVRTIDATSSCIEIEWYSEGQSHVEHGFKVRYHKSGEEEKPSMTDTLQNSTKAYNLCNLNSNTQYVICVLTVHGDRGRVTNGTCVRAETGMEYSAVYVRSSIGAVMCVVIIMVTIAFIRYCAFKQKERRRRKHGSLRESLRSRTTSASSVHNQSPHSFTENRKRTPSMCELCNAQCQTCCELSHSRDTGYGHSPEPSVASFHCACEIDPQGYQHQHCHQQQQGEFSDKDRRRLLRTISQESRHYDPDLGSASPDDTYQPKPVCPALFKQNSQDIPERPWQPTTQSLLCRQDSNGRPVEPSPWQDARVFSMCRQGTQNQAVDYNYPESKRGMLYRQTSQGRQAEPVFLLHDMHRTKRDQFQCDLCNAQHSVDSCTALVPIPGPLDRPFPQHACSCEREDSLRYMDEDESCNGSNGFTSAQATTSV